jgi:NAD+ kinase
VQDLFKSVGLVARFDRKKAVGLAEDLAKHLKAKGLRVYLEDTLAEKTGMRGETVPLGRMNTDFIITIGGDGTILRTCISIPKPEPPLLAINMGVRGFLTEVEPKQAFTSVDKCLSGEFKIERCMKLSIGADGIMLPDALNEVVISADEPAKLLYARILRNKEPIINCQSDGLMVSTQTGSTGYSLSAGGPILHPQVPAVVLTPICPHTLSFRPLAVPSTSSISVRLLTGGEDVYLTLDGQRGGVLVRNDVVDIRKAPFELQLITSPHRSYYDLVKEKLGWAE